MPKIEPILIYAGQASQAIELYQKAFNAEVKVKMKYSDANPKDFQYKYEDEHRDFIYHAQLKIGKQVIMLCDDCRMDADAQGKTPFMIDLVVLFKTDDELKTAYEALSEGATITEPLQSQTYCSLTCALVDKFGGRWQLMSGYGG